MEDLYSILLLPTLATVEVFKTNVQTCHQAGVLVSELQSLFPGRIINFDLEDCDRILRIEGNPVDSEKVILLLQGYGLECALLEG